LVTSYGFESKFETRTTSIFEPTVELYRVWPFVTSVGMLSVDLSVCL